MEAQDEAIVEMTLRDDQISLDAIFRAQYGRVVRIIAKVIRDPGHAEELAVEVFLKWSRNPLAKGPKSEGWLYRTAVRMALDELRREARRARFDGVLALTQPPTPEELHAATQEQNKVRAVLAALPRRKGELLLLRSQGLNYEQLASALDLNPASVGTILSRAQMAFRKEYLKRYGDK